MMFQPAVVRSCRKKKNIEKKKSFYCSRSFCTAFILHNPLQCNILLHVRSFKVKFRARCAFQHEGEKALSRSHHQSRLQNHESSVRLVKTAEPFSVVSFTEWGSDFVPQWSVEYFVNMITVFSTDLSLPLFFLLYRYHSGTQAEPGRRPRELPVYTFKFALCDAILDV